MWFAKTRVAVLLGFVAIVIVLQAGFGMFQVLSRLLPNEIWGYHLNADQLWWIAFAIVVGLLVFQRQLVIEDLRFRLNKKVALQTHVNKLAEFRKYGITELYAPSSPPSNIAEFTAWVAKEERWEWEVLSYLKAHFEYAVVEWFEHLGALQSKEFIHASSDEVIRPQHVRYLTMLAKRLAIIEELIQKHTGLLPYQQPTFRELLASIWRVHRE
jgi:hypothetical protein